MCSGLESKIKLRIAIYTPDKMKLLSDILMRGVDGYSFNLTDRFKLAS